MPRRISPSQLNSMIRQEESRRKKAIADYNRAVKDLNRKVNQAVDSYNRQARAHNVRVRANRQRLASELQRLATSSRPRTGSIRASSHGLHRAFVRVEARVESRVQSAHEDHFLELSERETANSLAALNALEGQGSTDSDADMSRLTDTAVGDELETVSPDLDRRWKGALFALDARNPDAARHFCTSAREVFTNFLELRAPDGDVLAAYPACERAPDGRPTRRTRIRLMLTRKGIATDEYEDFVDQDVENVLDLFKVFNDGTHGPAGTYSLAQLRVVKRRVEDGILFLASLAS